MDGEWCLRTTSHIFLVNGYNCRGVCLSDQCVVDFILYVVNIEIKFRLRNGIGVKHVTLIIIYIQSKPL